MKRFVRTIFLLTAITAISTGPVLAFECAPNLYGYYHGDLVTGHLIGFKRVSLTAGLSAYFESQVSEQLCVGTYEMLARGGRTFRLELRCDNYSVWGLF